MVLSGVPPAGWVAADPAQPLFLRFLKMRRMVLGNADHHIDVGENVLPEEFPIVGTVGANPRLGLVECVLQDRDRADNETGWLPFDLKRVPAGRQLPHGFRRLAARLPRHQRLFLVVQPHRCLTRNREKAPALTRVHETNLLLACQSLLAETHQFADEVVEHLIVGLAGGQHDRTCQETKQHCANQYSPHHLLLCHWSVHHPSARITRATRPPGLQGPCRGSFAMAAGIAQSIKFW